MLMRGFSLLEMLLAISLSSLIILATLALFPQLQRQQQRVYLSQHLERIMYSAISGLAKDIRRAGFIATDPETPTTLEPLTINKAKNCIVIRYDHDANGRWDLYPLDPKMSDVFAYRYAKNNLEFQRGITHCRGSGWEKMLDPAEIKITGFFIGVICWLSAYYIKRGSKKR